MEFLYNKTKENSEQTRNKKKIEERLKKNCLYDTNVYDQMLDDSLLICNMLQTHLNDCINGVRAQSPSILTSPFTSPQTTPILPRAQLFQSLLNKKNYSISTNSILDKKYKEELVSTFDKNFLRPLTIESNSFPQITRNFINRQQKMQSKEFNISNILKKQNNNIKKKNTLIQSSIGNLPPIPKTESLF